MWSDPDEIETWGHSPRGAGYLFGSQVTSKFMEKNALDLICRAHQLVDEGNMRITFIPFLFHVC